MKRSDSRWVIVWVLAWAAIDGCRLNNYDFNGRDAVTSVMDSEAVDGRSNDAAPALDIADAADARVDVGEIDATVPGCDPNETPDPQAVYVSPGATAGDGTAIRPLGTIAAGVGAAKARAVPTVYLDRGTYSETVDITGASAGIVITGGFVRAGVRWTRDCRLTQRDETLIAAPTPTAATITAQIVRSGFANLTIATPGMAPGMAGMAGGSSIGLFVRGDHSVVSLRNVVILTGRGADGQTAMAPAMAGNRTDCATCTAADAGRVGMGGAIGGAAGHAGTFDATGYHPVDGQTGTEGTQGDNGPPGSPGTTMLCLPDCGFVDDGSCPGARRMICLGAVPVTSGTGYCGCGGLGGAPGSVGRGGGASVALLVVGMNATVDIQNCQLEASDGGSGSNGGPGGAPGPGAMGAQGTTPNCANSCSANCLACNRSGPDIPGGAGTMGFAGGVGGPSGGGAGGPSYAIVTVGMPIVSTANTTLQAQNGGTGMPAGGHGARLDL